MCSIHHIVVFVIKVEFIGSNSDNWHRKKKSVILKTSQVYIFLGHNVSFSRSGEDDLEERLDGIISVPQEWHKKKASEAFYGLLYKSNKFSGGSHNSQQTLQSSWPNHSTWNHAKHPAKVSSPQGQFMHQRLRGVSRLIWADIFEFQNYLKKADPIGTNLPGMYILPLILISFLVHFVVKFHDHKTFCNTLEAF